MKLQPHKDANVIKCHNEQNPWNKVVETHTLHDYTYQVVCMTNDTYWGEIFYSGGYIRTQRVHLSFFRKREYAVRAARKFCENTLTNKVELGML
jgi:hypothetical protein